MKKKFQFQQQGQVGQATSKTETKELILYLILMKTKSDHTFKHYLCIIT